VTGDLRLADLTKGNWERVASLAVKPEQQNFVAPNLRTIAEMQFFDNTFLRVIMKGRAPVGLAAYGIDTDDENWWLFRFMIAGSEQGKGYGRKALELLIEEWRTIPDIDFILLGYYPDNVVAERLYVSAGFVPGEIASWGERIARLDLKPSAEQE
jgi:diamine N-acetyltransferase